MDLCLLVGDSLTGTGIGTGAHAPVRRETATTDAEETTKGVTIRMTEMASAQDVDGGTGRGFDSAKPAITTTAATTATTTTAKMEKREGFCDVYGHITETTGNMDRKLS